MIGIGNVYGFEVFDCVSSDGKRFQRFDSAAWNDPSCAHSLSPKEQEQLKEQGSLRCRNSQCKLRILKSSAGFITNGEVDGVAVRFLIDTGATNTALSSALAKVTRIETKKLSDSARVHTVAGDVSAELVTSVKVSVGTLPPIKLPVLITRTMTEPYAILGQDYLKHMSTSIKGNVMEITFEK